MMQLLTPTHFNDYELLDCGDFEKLERFGKYITIRPEPQAVWPRLWPTAEWEKQAHVKFVPRSSSSGDWKKLKQMPDQWEINYPLEKGNSTNKASLVFRLGLTSFKHVGVFPEQAVNWDKLYSFLKDQPKARFLNLFAYTCSASLHAALGGATKTVSVDLSNTYLNWGKRNFALNGLAETQHQFIEADVMSWLAQCKESFDVIFIDPPTFSNSKKIQGVFDVQRDHVELLTLAMRLLKPNGICYFSTNFKRFELQQDAMNYLKLHEISHETIGFDYKRNTKIHRCWQVAYADNE